MLEAAILDGKVFDFDRLFVLLIVLSSPSAGT
jgi:hypothetical protein